MTFDRKYGYERTGNKTFIPVARTVPAPGNQDGGESAADRAARDRDYLFSRFGWFWGRRAEIFNTPEIYRLYPLFSGLSLAYVGGGPLSLGMLFRLWHAGLWVAKCPECGGAALIYFTGGSPISGANSRAARCIFCGANVTGNAEKFHELWRPAKKLIDEAGLAKRQPSAKSGPPKEKPREDFRAISRRWRRDYDEKSEAELEQAAAERKAREEDERRRAIEAARQRYAAIGLSETPLPSEIALEMLKNMQNIKEETT